MSLILAFFQLLAFSAHAQVDTLICDNGGFEDDFQYYEGERTTYFNGSDSCSLVDAANNPVVWEDVLTLPSAKEFEIVTTGIDPLVGFDMVKFGNKALKLNNQYGHTLPNGYSCAGSRGVNKLTKRFKVTEENRDFTIWYSAILENPAGHLNSQPFVNIQCNRAPNDELCLDADFLECEEKYTDPNCSYDGIDALDWSCHRFKIPKEFIDSIAVIEMTVGDCGCGGHFGYGYIDGMCEECTGSALGSGQLYDSTFDGLVGISNCVKDQMTICGDFNLPLLCGTWDVDTILINGAVITDMEIDRIDSTFCFVVDKSALGDEKCIDLFAEFTFSTTSNNMVPTQQSNSIEICQDDFRSYITAAYVGECSDNDTDANISDDYYFVDVPIYGTQGDSWEITRSLRDPYPNESGSYTIKTGAGDDTYRIGPFLIQEGEWLLTINIGGCTYYHYIFPPEYCSGCKEFNDLEISNIQCIANDPADPFDDTWSFDFRIPGSDSTNPTYLFGNQTHFYNAPAFEAFNGLISAGCQTFTISDFPDCDNTTFTVCPPKPCSSISGCDIEVYTTEIICRENNQGYYLNLNLEATGQFYCYSANLNLDPSVPSTATSPNNTFGSLGVGSNPIGPFTEDVYIKVYKCDVPDCDNERCEMTPCYKYMYVPKPDCRDRDFPTTRRSQMNAQVDEVSIYPNPLGDQSLTIESTMSITKMNLLDIRGNRISTIEFEGATYQLNLDILPGLYILQYEDRSGNISFIKFIKQ